MGKIKLSAMEFYAFHGVYAEERKNGNRFDVNLTVEYDFEGAVKNDDLMQTLDYCTLYELTKAVMENPMNLLESLALQIASNIKHEFPSINEVIVEVSKYDPPIGGKCKCASVEVTI